MEKVSRAICFATEALDGVRRKAENTPAIFHSLEAAAIVHSVIDDEDAVCAAFLHDTIEDANVTYNQIEALFGSRVAMLVAAETENKYPGLNPEDTWLMRKKQTLRALHESTDIGVRALWLGDKLSNMRSLGRLKARFGNDMWNRFHQKDPVAHREYYVAVARELEMFANTEVYAQLLSLIEQVFGGIEDGKRQ